jgi:hypothetical protein
MTTLLLVYPAVYIFAFVVGFACFLFILLFVLFIIIRGRLRIQA